MEIQISTQRGFLIVRIGDLVRGKTVEPFPYVTVGSITDIQIRFERVVIYITIQKRPNPVEVDPWTVVLLEQGWSNAQIALL